MCTFMYFWAENFQQLYICFLQYFTESSEKLKTDSLLTVITVFFTSCLQELSIAHVFAFDNIFLESLVCLWVAQIFDSKLWLSTTLCWLSTELSTASVNFLRQNFGFKKYSRLWSLTVSNPLLAFDSSLTFSEWI